MFFLQVIAERETTVRLVAERESLKTQLCTARTTHTELEAALKDAERRLLETLAALESRKDEFSAKERADAETAETLRRMKEAQSDKETDLSRLRTSLAESQATIASLNADIEGTHATHAREIERLNDELTAERTKVTSLARDAEELNKKLTQSESESVALNRSAHTEKLQLQKRLEAEEAESKTKIGELTAEVSRLSALVDGAETNGTSIFLTLIRAIRLTDIMFYSQRRSGCGGNTSPNSQTYEPSTAKSWTLSAGDSTRSWTLITKSQPNVCTGRRRRCVRRRLR